MARKPILKKIVAVLVAGIVLAAGSGQAVEAEPQREAEATLAAGNGQTEEIAWQSEVQGIPGQRLEQDLVMENGQHVQVVVDWEKDIVEVERFGDEVYAIPLSELSAYARAASQPGIQPLQANINWGSLCQWLVGVTGLGHAAIWSLVQPWIGIPYGVFWLFVSMQCD